MVINYNENLFDWKFLVVFDICKLLYRCINDLRNVLGCDFIFKEEIYEKKKLFI